MRNGDQTCFHKVFTIRIGCVSFVLNLIIEELDLYIR